VEIRIAETRLILRPDGTVHRPDLSTLYVADLHLGKAGSFRALGVPVPDGACAETLNRLSESLSQAAVTRLVILGDLWHDARAASPERVSDWLRWRSLHPKIRMELVVGNHDRKAGARVSEWGLDLAPNTDAPFDLRHEPPESREPTLCGHVHPGANVVLPGRQTLRLPAFWRRGDVLTLPAFGGFTGLAILPRRTGETRYVLAGDRVAALP
jgi:uncharacterized protein